MPKNNKPVVTFRAFNVSASVFKNDDNMSVTISKSYKEKGTNKYKETNTFFADDLPRLALVANKAYEYMQLKES